MFVYYHIYVKKGNDSVTLNQGEKGSLCYETVT